MAGEGGAEGPAFPGKKLKGLGVDCKGSHRPLAPSPKYPT